MSRTYKDRPEKVRFPEVYPWDSNSGYEKIPYSYTYRRWGSDEEITTTRYWMKPIAGAKTKKKKSVDTNWRWMNTPGWWTRMMMNRPQRREAHLWEHQVAKTPVEELEEVDKPNCSHKPHVYYW